MSEAPANPDCPGWRTLLRRIERLECRIAVLEGSLRRDSSQLQPTAALIGALLPLVLRKLGFDPAGASAPVVATQLDLSGVLIYFTLAQVLLRGRLL
jgi:hypothetical protein